MTLPLPPSLSTPKLPSSNPNSGNGRTRKIKDKMAAMKAYRRANGLCYKCRDKWSPNNHVCANTVPLHLVDELWALMAEEEDTEVLQNFTQFCSRQQST